METAKDIATYVIKKCIADNHPISNLQLQKILYLIQRNFLKKNKEAFEDDFEAWRYGPIIPDVYYKYCTYGSRPICSENKLTFLKQADKETVDEIILKTRDLPPWQLAKSILNLDGAWAKTYYHRAEKDKKISKELIRKEM